MKRLTILGILVFVGLIVVPAGHADKPGGKDVNIVNPLPIPVTGEIGATVDGEVEVTNARQAVFYRVDVNLPSEEDFVWGLIDLPEGKRLVIEHICVEARNTTANEKIQAGISTKLDDSVLYSQPIGVLTPGVPLYGNRQYLVQPVKIYADTHITLAVERSDTTNNVSVFYPKEGDFDGKKIF